MKVYGIMIGIAQESESAKANFYNIDNQPYYSGIDTYDGSTDGNKNLKPKGTLKL